MKFLLCNPPSPQGYHVMRSYSGGYGDLFKVEQDSGELIQFPPIELLAFASLIRESGHDVEVRDYQVIPYEEASFREWVENSSGDAFLQVISLPTLESDCRLASIGKEVRPAMKVFIRSNITYPDVVEDALRKSGADAVIFPDSILDFFQIVQGERLRNVAYLNEADELTMTETERIQEVDTLPIPARDLIDAKHYCFPLFRKTPIRNIATFHSSYGCPHPCGYYCPYPLAEGKKVRMHSVARMIQEMWQIKRLGITGVIFRDPLFTYDQNRIREFCEALIAEDLVIDWWCETRIDRLSFELLELMKKSGCVGLEVGVESGDEEVMAKQAKRGLNLEKLMEFQAWTRELDLHVAYLFLIGLPVETPMSIFKTLKLILDMELKEDEYNLSFITPYLGTPLYFEGVEKNWILRDWNDFSGYSVVMKTDYLSEETMLQTYELGEELKEIISARAHSTPEEFGKRQEQFLIKAEQWACQYV
ncbi:hypothetical protein CBW65_04365 [Tumebacillus avium]|uniref:Radical SAM core domain-containing protein n=1 Tax=Tumebacillus avium TaxID=1903704 RepID=A0A1Y0IM11_9BACL|nr:radical SAM protein [Tumebacillus avium]ARU60384.1 hypothetical protein CBW65_04365 [Tumebacillus avium]